MFSFNSLVKEHVIFFFPPSSSDLIEWEKDGTWAAVKLFVWFWWLLVKEWTTQQTWPFLLPSYTACTSKQLQHKRNSFSFSSLPWSLIRCSFLVSRAESLQKRAEPCTCLARSFNREHANLFHQRHASRIFWMRERGLAGSHQIEKLPESHIYLRESRNERVKRKALPLYTTSAALKAWRWEPVEYKLHC